MLKIRVDDVLQPGLFSIHQRKVFAIKTPFEWFKEATGQLENYPLVLAIVADGIKVYPEWIDFIKKHPLWKVECHGWEHRTYSRLPYEEMVSQLRRAKEEIEKTFNQEVKEFYPPKLKYNDLTSKASQEVGLLEMRERFRPVHWFADKSIKSIYFHYWDKNHIQQINKILCQQFPEKL